MEVYKAVIGHDGLYEVSNLGNVKSFKFGKERQIKPVVGSHGYLTVILSKSGVLKTRTVHSLVAEAFLNHVPCGHKLVINHIDFNRLNNCVTNLEIVTNRENSNRKHIKLSSKFTGVSWYKPTGKWLAQIRINGKVKNIGYFTDELEASVYYENALLALHNGTEIITKPNDFTSKYKGVSWYKPANKWRVSIWINGKQKYLGLFTNELEASHVYQNVLLSNHNKQIKNHGIKRKSI